MHKVSKCAEINCSSFDNLYCPLEDVNIEILILKATVRKLLSSLFFILLYVFSPSFAHASPPDPPPMTTRSYSNLSAKIRGMDKVYQKRQNITDLIHCESEKRTKYNSDIIYFALFLIPQYIISVTFCYFGYKFYARDYLHYRI